MSRLKALQTACPFEMKILFCVDGTLMQEQAVHSSLLVAFTRIGLPMPPNEWYPGRNEFFHSFLKELSISANVGIAYCEKYNCNVKQWSKKRGQRVPNIKWPNNPYKKLNRKVEHV